MLIQNSTDKNDCSSLRRAKHVWQGTANTLKFMNRKKFFSKNPFDILASEKTKHHYQSCWVHSWRQVGQEQQLARQIFFSEKFFGLWRSRALEFSRKCQVDELRCPLSDTLRSYLTLDHSMRPFMMESLKHVVLNEGTLRFSVGFAAFLDFILKIHQKDAKGQKIQS